MFDDYCLVADWSERNSTSTNSADTRVDCQVNPLPTTAKAEVVPQTDQASSPPDLTSKTTQKGSQSTTSLTQRLPNRSKTTTRRTDATEPLKSPGSQWTWTTISSHSRHSDFSTFHGSDGSWCWDSPCQLYGCLLTGRSSCGNRNVSDLLR